MNITVYEKPTCTTCRNLAKLLKENGIDYDKVNYFIEPLGEKELRGLAKKIGEPAFAMLRTKEPRAKELGLTSSSSNDEIIRAIAADPNLLNRPIVEVGDKAIVARPAEKALELIKNAR